MATTHQDKSMLLDAILHLQFARSVFAGFNTSTPIRQSPEGVLGELTARQNAANAIDMAIGEIKDLLVGPKKCGMLQDSVDSTDDSLPQDVMAEVRKVLGKMRKEFLESGTIRGWRWEDSVESVA